MNERELKVIQLRVFRKMCFGLKAAFAYEMNLADERNDQSLVLILKHWIEQIDNTLKNLPI